MKRRVLLYRSNRAAPFKSEDGKVVDRRPVDEVLKSVPIGSRVLWHNERAPANSEFDDENALKVGDDQYAAHGFGAGGSVFPRTVLEFRLAQAAHRYPLDPVDAIVYIQQNIYVKQIETFDTPNNR